MTAAEILLPLLDEQLVRNKAPDVDEAIRLGALNVAISSFERAAGRVFFPRTQTDKIHADCWDHVLRLPISYSEVTDLASIDGPDGSIDVGGVTSRGRRLYTAAGWPAGTYTVTYTYGPDTREDFISRAIVLIATSILADGPWDDRGYAVDDGTGLVRLLTAGVSGATFSIPEVQSALMLVRVPLVGGP